jgi:hypothetical protein
MNKATFASAISKEFNRVISRNMIRCTRMGISAPSMGLIINSTDTNIMLNFKYNDNDLILNIPIPYVDETGCEVVRSSDCVVRAVNSYMIKKTNTKDDYLSLDYMGFIYWTLIENIRDFYPELTYTCFLERIINGMFNGNPMLSLGQTQRHIDSKIVNMLPVCESSMKTWAMNKRVVLLDPEFDKLTPDQKLEYQMEKNRRLFPFTSIGLSDGVLADQNYILKQDIKCLTPYGEKHHNPQRNLYQTLGMKGKDVPNLMTKSEAALVKAGVTRTGWDLMTAFLTTPDTFEDQIILDNRLRDLSVSETRKFTSYGALLVKTGDRLVYGAIMSAEPDDSEQRFEVHCDDACVEAIDNSSAVINGKEIPTYIITVKITRKFKEGFKITNRHGNKGVIRFAELGMVHDPVRGDIPLDVIVSCDSIRKRKNFGQVLEALTTLIHGKDSKLTIPDEYCVSTDKMVKTLTANGYKEDGTCDISTVYGNFKAVCGWIFWGITRTPEDQIWTPKETSQTDVSGLRTAGNKVSTIEISALITMMGPNNGAVKEILQYTQGQDLIKEELTIIGSMVGNTDSGTPQVNVSELEVCEDGSVFHEKEALTNTIHDSSVYPEGAYINLSFKYYVAVSPSMQAPIYESIVPPAQGLFNRVYEIDKIYMPSELLRRTWQHKTGLVGLSTLGTVLNRFILDCKRYVASNDPEDMDSASNSIRRYFATVSNAVGGKKGHLSTYTMAVRYPNSVKGVAVQKSELPSNTVEIHHGMAEALGVTHGQLVLCERFPCLGFPSIRIQRVAVTSDDDCKYVIRVSGNSLVSQALDFDGDVIYLMSFFTPQAKRDLTRAFKNPHPKIAEIINELNSKKVPTTKEMVLQDYELTVFEKLTADSQSSLVERAVGVKAHTGPVIALCYNLMRIIETASKYNDTEFRASMEKFLDKIGNSVFSQKHGTESLQAACIEAVCCANVNKLVELGFPLKESQKLSSIISSKASNLGIFDLIGHYQEAMSGGRSKIINVIVRNENKVYFASRSKLQGPRILDYLKQGPVDIPSHMFFSSIRPREAGLV